MLLIVFFSKNRSALLRCRKISKKTAFSKSIMLEIRAYYANVMFYIYNVIIFSKYLHSFLYFSHILCKNRAIRTLCTAGYVLCTHIARAK